ncbi:MAG: PHP domain-containing protein [Candidatus Hadarchaeales archaeon]
MKADLHVHTEFSDGRDPPEVMIEAAEARGLKLLAITDHGPALHVGMKENEISGYLSTLENLRENAKLKLLVGIEANVLNESGDIDIEEETREKLDILVLGIHRLWFVSDPREMALAYLRSLVNAIKKHKIDVVAHPFQFHGDLSRFLTIDEIRELLEVAASRGTAIEVNEKYRAPGEDFYRACLENGVMLSVGTDSHRAESVGRLDWVSGMLEKIGVSEGDLLYTRFLR